MSEAEDRRYYHLFGKVCLLERALLRTMTLLIARDPNPQALLEDLRQDFVAFVPSLPLTPR